MGLCKDFAIGEVCSTAADGTRKTYLAHYEYGSDIDGNSIISAVRYTDADGVAVDLSDSLVTASACPVFSPDVEFEKFCDVQTDGTAVEFICRTITSFDASGEVVDPSIVTYLDLDKVTPYSPTGTVGPCSDCLPAAAQGVLTTWGA